MNSNPAGTGWTRKAKYKSREGQTRRDTTRLIRNKEWTGLFRGKRDNGNDKGDGKPLYELGINRAKIG